MADNARLFSIRSLLLTFGIPLFFYIKRQYDSFRANQRANRVSVRDVPPKMYWCLNILAISTLIFFTLSIDYVAWTPENIFKTTSSRLFTPVDELFDRLATKRPLTTFDQALKERMLSQNSRQLYAAYGPDAIANCPFCKHGDASSYRYYVLPSILAVHAFNLGIWGAVTSSGFAGTEGSRWRTQATIAGLALLTIDLYKVASYDFTTNATARQLKDVEWFFWNWRLIRYLALASTNALLCVFLWLTSTNRLLAQPPTLATRLNNVTQSTALLNNSISQLIILRNTIFRQPQLRDRMVEYWTQEEQVMREVREDPEVVSAMQSALASMPPQALEQIPQTMGNLVDSFMSSLQELKKQER
jgi:hypothetical protein